MSITQQQSASNCNASPAVKSTYELVQSALLIGKNGFHAQPSTTHTDLEWPRPAPITLNVDYPVTECEQLQRESGGKEHVRTGPKRLIDRKERIPCPAQHHAHSAGHEHAHDFVPTRSFAAQPVTS